MGLIGEEAYAEDVRQRRAVPARAGRTKCSSSRWTRACDSAAEEQDYEQAAAYRDQIRTLSKGPRDASSSRAAAGVDADVVAAGQRAAA